MNRSMSMYADTVFINGVVITVERNDTVCKTAAVRDKYIVYTGDNEGAKLWTGPETKVIDLNGRALLPGFVDAHCHLGMRGQNAAVILDCSAQKAPDIPSIQRIIREEAQRLPKGAWIKATGYDQGKLKEGRHPTRAELDEAAPDNPVQLTRTCLHMGVYNTKALEAGDIHPENFAKGEVVTDENGQMTGLLKERACTYMWDKVMYTKEEYMRAFKTANDMFLRCGITSVHDASFYGSDTIGLYQEACENGIIDVRMYVLIYHACGKEKTIEWVNDFIKTGIRGGLGNEHFRLGHVKILIDGSTSGPSCAVSRPYEHDPALEGIQLYTQEEADAVLIPAHNAGFNITAHAVGDKAVDVILSSIEKAQKLNPRPCRHRIEHCAIINDEIIARLKKANVTVVSNPGFFIDNAAMYIKYYGDRVNCMFPLKSYLDKGIITAIGSDTPVIEPDPMIGIYTAVKRADSRTGTVAGACQQIGIMDAIRMYTYNGAYASLEEGIKGSIEPGKLADLVVLSDNILEAQPEEIMNIKTDITMIDGRIKYERI